MDTLSRELRSKRMAGIRNKDSAPEMRLRRLIHGMGFRYRLHVRALPGTPDVVFPARRAVIFMHGCFWHRHEGCALARLPKSRIEFWKKKLESNRLRDRNTLASLSRLGWRVLVVWECQMKDEKHVARVVRQFLADAEREGME